MPHLPLKAIDQKFNELLLNKNYKQIIALLINNSNIFNQEDLIEPFNTIIILYIKDDYNRLLLTIKEIIKTHTNLYLFFINEIFKKKPNKNFFKQIKIHLTIDDLENKIFVNLISYLLYKYLKYNNLNKAVKILNTYKFLLNNLIFIKFTKRERFIFGYFAGLTLFLSGDFMKAFKFLKISYILLPVKFLNSKLKKIGSFYGFLVEIIDIQVGNKTKINYLNHLWEKENDLFFKDLDFNNILFFKQIVSPCLLDIGNKGIVSKLLGIYVLPENIDIDLIKCYCLFEYLINKYGKYFFVDNKMFIECEILSKSYDILCIKRTVFDDFLKLIHLKMIRGFYDFQNGIYVIESMERKTFDF
ncbi:hypothetical protein CDIK_3380 [Cucumispora dikerogammari]|nr:hypothetical protein CDIK_3380 [Cucumispora dikerogammari]